MKLAFWIPVIVIFFINILELCSRVQLNYWETVQPLDLTFEAAPNGPEEHAFSAELFSPISEANLLACST